MATGFTFAVELNPDDHVNDSGPRGSSPARGRSVRVPAAVVLLNAAILPGTPSDLAGTPRGNIDARDTLTRCAKIVPMAPMKQPCHGGLTFLARGYDVTCSRRISA
ncbi:hypothetical protein D3C73_1296060 [compost metagenome]